MQEAHKIDPPFNKRLYNGKSGHLSDLLKTNMHISLKTGLVRYKIRTLHESKMGSSYNQEFYWKRKHWHLHVEYYQEYLAYVTFPSIPLVSPTGIFLFYSCNNTPFRKNWCVETKEKPAKQTGMGLRQPKESAKFELQYERLKR